MANMAVALREALLRTLWLPVYLQGPQAVVLDGGSSWFDYTHTHTHTHTLLLGTCIMTCRRKNINCKGNVVILDS